MHRKNVKFVLFASMLAAVFNVGSVNAVPVLLSVNGIVTDDASGTFAVNSAFFVSVSYDTDNFLDGFKYTPTTIELSMSGDLVTNSLAQINVEPNAGGIDSYQYSDEGNPWSGQISGFTLLDFALNFQGHDLNELDDFISSEPYVLDLVEWEVKNGGLVFETIGNVGLEVQSFELATVPEPSTLVVMVLGLTGFLFRYRRVT